jgi:hypothetical protein
VRQARVEANRRRARRHGEQRRWRVDDAHREHQRAWAGQTIQLRVEALDANPGSLIEAGVDNVTIIRQ